jgi:hypothetical protein
MATTDETRYVAALARAVALLRRSPEPGRAQKDAIRALVSLAAGRSAALRFYDGVLTLDSAAVGTADPRLAAFAERLVAQNVAEITVAKGAGPDELLGLVLGLAADAGLGRIKERLRDAGSTRVMVVLHQYDQRSKRSVTAAFEKVHADQSVMEEWNRFLEQGAKAESDRVADAQPPGLEVVELDAGGAAASPAAAPEAPATDPGLEPPATAESLPALTPVPPPTLPRTPRTSVLEEAPTPEGWYAGFERSVRDRFRDHFGDVDWAYRIDRAAGTVSAGATHGRSSLAVALPRDYLTQSSWLLAGKLLDELRKLAEKEGAIRKKR